MEVNQTMVFKIESSDPKSEPLYAYEKRIYLQPTLEYLEVGIKNLYFVFLLNEFYYKESTF